MATYNGVPIIPSKDVQTDTLSRMYFLDTDYVYFSTAIPTQYFESGIETGDPFAINRLGQKECTAPWENYGRLSRWTRLIRDLK